MDQLSALALASQRFRQHQFKRRYDGATAHRSQAVLEPTVQRFQCNDPRDRCIGRSLAPEPSGAHLCQRPRAIRCTTCWRAIATDH
jgi:hypothetical protein